MRNYPNIAYKPSNTELLDFVKSNKDILLKILHQSEETGKEKGIAFCQTDGELSVQGEYSGEEWRLSPSEIKCVTGNKIGEYHTHPEAEENPPAQGFSPADILSALKEQRKIICLGYRDSDGRPKDNIECFLFHHEAKDKAPFKEQKAIDQKALLMRLANHRQIEILNLAEGTKIPHEFIEEFNLLTDIMLQTMKDFMALGKDIDYVKKEKIV